MSSNLDVGPFGGGNTAVFQDVQASGVASQSFTNTEAVVRLNTEIIQKDFATLSSNQVTLDAGKYYLLFSKQYLWGSTSGSLQIWAEDIGSGNSIGGFNQRNASSNGRHNANGSFGFYIDISVQTTIELKAKYSTVDTISGGTAVSETNVNEYYHSLSVTKIG